MATVALSPADCECEMTMDGIVASLHWLAFLLTGRSETSANLVIETLDAVPDRPFISQDSRLAWCRTSIIQRALATIRDNLAASARRVRLSSVAKFAVPASRWTLDHRTTKLELQQALLDIDIFPRVALLLSIFESLPIEAAAIVLGADLELVRQGQRIALHELTLNLAKIQGWTGASPCPIDSID